MTKSILVSLAILTLSTSVVLAAQRTQSRAVKPSASAAAMNPNPYARPMNPNAAFARMGPSPVIFAPGVSNSDRELYHRNLRESGYDKKNDFNPTGTIRTQ
jgi:hypothetical protein